MVVGKKGMIRGGRNGGSPRFIGKKTLLNRVVDEYRRRHCLFRQPVFFVNEDAKDQYLLLQKRRGVKA